MNPAQHTAEERRPASGLSVCGMLLAVLAAGIFTCAPALHAQQAAEREAVTISVVVANPSKEKTQTIPVKIDLPMEVTPSDILENEGLAVQYDDQRSIYFLYNEKVELKPKQTRVFNVQVKDVWFIKDEVLAEPKSYADVLLGRMQGTEYFDSGKRLYDLIVAKLDEIASKQKDESLGQKQRIGAYRLNLQALEDVKELLAKMEKILDVTSGGIPTPDMPEKWKSEAPSAKTTWMVIFAIMFFLGILGFVLFITWHRKAAAEKIIMENQPRDLPGDFPGTEAKNRVA